MQGLTGKRVIVAGGATGIGAATAERLTEAGAAVAIGDVNLERARETADRLVAAGGKATAIEFDLSDDRSVEAFITESAGFLGGVDGLFNVGAEMTPAVFKNDLTAIDTDMEIWKRVLDVNLLGYARTIKVALPLMLESGGGSIVNTSSGAAFNGLNNRVAYSASKAGVNALSRHVATVWGREGVRCNSVMPGMVIGETQKRMNHHELHAEIMSRIRSPRLGAPSDIAAIVTYLLSDDGEWVNGQSWNVDGGLSLRD
ncbi:SDR family NAD(P)-dependent oxidoreductase [Rhodococcoides yunnanense]|uniref:SDR family NAD(P)-dependent oxidoreductase n=1 Tax=Rhodococcoides yunnanense TaxID=278209 RepID=UPI0009325B3E|nr:SDR family oxidoreductase [Rhodococcus yunnanensis]